MIGRRGFSRHRGGDTAGSVVAAAGRRYVSGTVGLTATGLTYEVVGALATGGTQIIGQARSVNGYFSYTGFKY